MSTDSVTMTLREKFELLLPTMSERMRRHWAATEALALGRGGITHVAEATGMSRTTITTGIRELRQDAGGEAARLDPTRCRQPGAGRPCLELADATLIRDLELMVAPATRGDPMSPLLWTCKSTRQLAKALGEQGHAVSHQTVATLLRHIGYNPQVNRKTREGSSHPDRNAQFEFISRQVVAFQRCQQPVVSVDTKKKEIIGDFKNGGAEWQPEGQPEDVRAKDFPDKKLGKAIPYGVYDLTCNRGWVSVGIDHDTARFAVRTLGRWWAEMGQPLYPTAERVLITADGGGSNGHRVRLWKLALQEWASESGLRISVCHFPPGTSKWNKIEHRMFCHITKNWRGRPLTSRAVVVNLIANTTTTTGLTIQVELDEGEYPLRTKVTDEELAGIHIKRNKFHGEWNYTILPKV
jgi:mRNA-degrading endonuclease toxin of MazEF toxin-antitoxin module